MFFFLFKCLHASPTSPFIFFPFWPPFSLLVVDATAAARTDGNCALGKTINYDKPTTFPERKFARACF